MVTLNQYLSKTGGAKCLESFCNLLTLYENQGVSASSEMWVTTSKLFSRVCGHDVKTQKLALEMMEKSYREEVHNPKIILEYARQLRSFGRYSDAILQYKYAAEIDIGKSDALHGVVLCHMLNGNFEEANDQIEFLSLMVEQDNEW